MKIRSSQRNKRRGRIEIIPLIDIMFFLLAAFMMVSINMIRVKSLKISLPTNIPSATPETKKDFISLSMNAEGLIQLDQEVIANKESLLPKLQALYLKNKDERFLISADQDSRHGDVMELLGKLRSVGFQKIAFSIKNLGISAPIPTSGNVLNLPSPPAPPPAPQVPTH